LESPPDRELFLADYLREIERAYPRQADGRVLFPFLRQFLIAYRA
jgi:trans-aconitate methyltransferase